jgi:hypothetical protein
VGVKAMAQAAGMAMASAMRVEASEMTTELKNGLK